MNKMLKLAAGCFLLIFWESRYDAFSKIHDYYSSNVSASVSGIILKSEKNRSSKSSAHNVEYQYVVDGYTFVSNTVSYRASGSSYSRRTVRRYPVGEKVTVYYDPRNPRYSVFELGGLESRVFFQALFGVFLALSVALWPAARSRSQQGARLT
ncbi:DUF3592 domain-containing protein [Microbulbifer sp. YPW1]|uniref:DUF3592 domain-containing protein n=1 Tax=Microbulbifer sp. YPW1 TaxID=2745199 RepID=UPI00159858B9|nr:DUF3592 domain-containing protein [Microbulbifer sp. YPW1]QKX17660.1 DUF3592 domain-containing protein [Microbulbifer sp. YPW1]